MIFESDEVVEKYFKDLPPDPAGWNRDDLTEYRDWLTYVLELAPDVSVKDVNKALRKFLLEYHPDKCRSEECKRDRKKIFVKWYEKYTNLKKVIALLQSEKASPVIQGTEPKLLPTLKPTTPSAVDSWSLQVTEPSSLRIADKAIQKPQEDKKSSELPRAANNTAITIQAQNAITDFRMPKSSNIFLAATEAQKMVITALKWLDETLNRFFDALSPIKAVAAESSGFNTSVYSTDPLGIELFETACMGYVYTLKELLAKEEYIQGINNKYSSIFRNRHHHPLTPLMCAASFGECLEEKAEFFGYVPDYIGTVKLLLANDARIEVDNDNGYTALDYAVTCKNSTTEMVKIFIDNKSNLNKRHFRGGTVLMLAASIAHGPERLKIIKLLLDNGAKPNAIDKFGDTALSFSLMAYGCSVPALQVVKTLLNAGAKVSYIHNGVWVAPALTLAARCSIFEPAIKTKIMRLLVNKASMVDLVGGLALLNAAQGQVIENIELLLEKGVSVNYVDQYNANALISTFKYYNHGGAEAKIVKLLLSKGIVINTADYEGRTALSYASEYSLFDAVKLLVANGATINTVDNLGLTPLMYVALNGGDEARRTKVAQLLLDNGSSIDHQSKDGWTALMYSFKYGALGKVVTVLMEHGADPTIKNNDGKTAVDIAKELFLHYQNEMSPDTEWTNRYQEYIKLSVAYQNAYFAKEVLNIESDYDLRNFFERNIDRLLEFIEAIIKSDLPENIIEQATKMLNIINSGTMSINPKFAGDLIVNTANYGLSSYLGCTVVFTVGGAVFGNVPGAAVGFTYGQPICAALGERGALIGVVKALLDNVYFVTREIKDSWKTEGKGRSAADIDKIANKIANGHAYEKHVSGTEGKIPGIKTKDELTAHIKKVMSDKNSIFKELKNGRSAYWHKESKTVVINDPGRADGGTVFRPDRGRDYFKELI